MSQTQPRGQRPGQPFLLPRRRPQKRRAVPSGPPEVQPRVRGDHTNISLFKDRLEKLNTGTIRSKTLVIATVAAPGKNPSAPAGHAAANTNSSSL